MAFAPLFSRAAGCLRGTGAGRIIFTMAKENQPKPFVKPQPPAQPAHKLPPIKREPEFGGQEGPEPTRYGDWEKNGRVSDF